MGNSFRRGGSPPRLLLMAFAIVLAASVLTACGSDDSSSSSSGTSSGEATTGDSGGSGDAVVEAAEKAVEEAYEGTYASPPTSGPKPEPGKEIWLISCGQSASSCAAPISEAQGAAKELGWKTKIVDGKFDPNLMAQGIRQAVAAGADGLLLQGVECPLVKAALEEAKAAGLKSVSTFAGDCNGSIPGKPGNLFSAQVVFGTAEEPLYFPEYNRDWSAERARWVIAETNGEAELVAFINDEYLALDYENEGFFEAFDECEGCTVLDEVPASVADLGPTMEQATQQALIKNPEANSVYPSVDGIITGGLSAGIRASGRMDELAVIGAECLPISIDLLRTGELDACYGVDQEWTAWAGVDTLNRLFHGEEAVPSGQGWQLVDKENNLPATGDWSAPIDFKSIYRETWGIAG